jgi:EamA domain-containing membrane protein RarD
LAKISGLQSLLVGNIKFVYDEPVTSVQLVSFSIIWTALLLFALEGFYHRSRRTLVPRV